MIFDLTDDFNIPPSATNITYGNGDCAGGNISEPFINVSTGEVDFTGAPAGIPLWYHVTFDLPGDNIECSPNNCIDIEVTPEDCDCLNCDPIILSTPPLEFECLEDVPGPNDLVALNITASGGCGALDIFATSGTGGGNACGYFIQRVYEACDQCGNCVEETQFITVTGSPECENPCLE